MSDILFPTDTTSVTPATGDIIMLADVSDSNNLKETTLAELPISTATQTAINAKQDTLTLTTTGTSGAATLVGSTLNIPQYSGGGGVTDHGALTGLADDDHTQYTKADGTRAFTGKVSYSSHPTFSADTELVDKKYVDDAVIAGGGYTDEQAQDAVGTILVDSSTIDFTYNDATPSITGSVIDGSITTTKLGGDITTAGKALLDDADASAQRTTLGLGTLSTQNGTFSGTSSGTNTGDETTSRINALYGTTNAFTAGSVELGHATDTTISRVSAGKIAVEGVNIGTEGILQNSQSAAYTLVLTDAGKHIYHPSTDTTARTWTIPANSSVAFPIGTAITFINDTSAGTITISITTDTLVLAGAGTTGSRTLTASGVATAVKVTSTRWIISGTNLT